MPRPLLPPRGTFIPTAILYDAEIPPSLKLTWMQLRGLAWGGSTSPPLRMEELERYTRKSRSTIYEHIAQLKLLKVLDWRTTGQEKLILVFPPENEVRIDRDYLPSTSLSLDEAQVFDDENEDLEDDALAEKPPPNLLTCQVRTMMKVVDDEPDVNDKASANSHLQGLRALADIDRTKPEPPANFETGLAWDDPTLQVQSQVGVTKSINNWEPRVDDPVERPEIRTEKASSPEIRTAEFSSPEIRIDSLNPEIRTAESENLDSLKLIKDQKERIINPDLINYLESLNNRSEINIKNIKNLICSDPPLSDSESQKRESHMINHDFDHESKRELEEERQDTKINRSAELYIELTKVIPDERQKERMQREVIDLDVWRDTIEHYLNHRWNPKNVPMLLELYKRGGVKGCFFCAHPTPKRLQGMSTLGGASLSTLKSVLNSDTSPPPPTTTPLAVLPSHDND